MLLPLEGTVDNSGWYCLECAAKLGSGYSAEEHLRNKHQEKPEGGVNYAQGWQVAQIRERLLEDAGPRIPVFITALRADGYGADDFLTDCGERRPV